MLIFAALLGEGTNTLEKPHITIFLLRLSKKGVSSQASTTSPVWALIAVGLLEDTVYPTLRDIEPQ